jgi:APA family basic amino acid/polyamine antiporter
VFADRLLRCKPLDVAVAEAEEPEYKLRRALGPVQLIVFGIGAIIGAGIFATIGTAAAGDAVRPGAGPALMLSFIITAAVCALTAFCYAEFASMVPISGSAYTYSYTTLGELVAWIIGWDLIIEYAVGNIAVAISWANYFKTFVEGFGIVIPDWMSMDYRTASRIVDANGVQTVLRDAPHVFGVPFIFNFLAVAIVMAITMVLIWGIRESARFTAIMVGVKIVVLTFFIIVGLYWVQPENWTPFAPNGWAGISAGAAIVFFAYIGFDAVSTVAEETRNPARDMPIGILGSLALSTFFYVVVAAVFTGLISYTDLQGVLATEQAEPLTLALAHASPTLGWAVGIVAFGSVVAHTAVLLVFQLGQPRILFAMSRDGLLPRVFGLVHERFRTPWAGTLLTGVFVASVAGVASIDEMVDLTNIGTLFAFILVCAGIMVLRHREPERRRPFKVPGGYVVPTLGILSCLYLVWYLPPTSWMRFAAWLNLGLAVYIGYGCVHSRMTGRATSDDDAAFDRGTASEGTWLVLGGMAALFFTHAVDIWLGGSTAAAAAEMPGLLTPGAWLHPSVFMILPLLIYALWVGPMLVHRVRHAGVPAGASEAAMRADTRGTLARVAVIEVIAIGYLLLLLIA